MNEIKIGNLSDLSMVHIIALKILLEYPKPLKRYTLYVMTNDYIKSELSTSMYSTVNDDTSNKLIKLSKKRDKVMISSSSFYNSLMVLEKKGLLSFNLGKDEKIKTIIANPLTKSAINTLLQFFIVSSVIPEPVEFDKELTERIMTLTGTKKVENTYTIWFTEYILIRLIELFSEISEDVYILSKKEDYGIYSNMNLDNVHFSEVHKSKIRDPDDITDLIVIPNYSRNIDFFGMTRIDVLKECIRILKPKGFLVVLAKADFPHIKDLSINQVLRVYKNSIVDSIFNKDQLDSDLKVAGFKKTNIFEYQGMLIGIGWIS